MGMDHPTLGKGRWAQGAWAGRPAASGGLTPQSTAAKPFGLLALGTAIPPPAGCPRPQVCWVKGLSSRHQQTTHTPQTCRLQGLSSRHQQAAQVPPPHPAGQGLGPRLRQERGAAAMGGRTTVGIPAGQRQNPGQDTHTSSTRRQLEASPPVCTPCSAIARCDSWPAAKAQGHQGKASSHSGASEQAKAVGGAGGRQTPRHQSG